MKIFPQSLAGRLTLFVLAALAVAQIVVFMMFAYERAEIAISNYRENIVGRTASVLQLARDMPPHQRRQLLRAASSRTVQYRFGDAPLADKTPDKMPDRAIAARMANALGLDPSQVRISVTQFKDRPDHFKRLIEGPDDDEDGDKRDWKKDRKKRYGRWMKEHRLLAMSIELPRGWLNVVTGPPPPPPPFGRAFLVSLGLSALAVGFAVFFMARRIVRPIRELADGAERLGRGDASGQLDESGPLEVRRTTRAFNEMRERIDRFVRDRTQMLAAISHDLRTPITAMRLRAELLDDEEARDKFVESVEELQAMTEAALAFARSDANPETSRPVDIYALTESLVDDFSEMGKAVRYMSMDDDAPRGQVLARLGGLKRALRNLIDNALTYGGSADVSVGPSDGGYTISIIDHGPGIEPEMRERMFDPFVRGESSRSRETGGIGLGLAISRDIIRNHGGDIALETTQGGGLTVLVSLPIAPAK